MAPNSTLWLLKFTEYASSPKSISNKYVPQKAYDFVSAFRELIVSQNLDLIYCGSNGPCIMRREHTSVPAKHFDLTLVTQSKLGNDRMSIDELKQSASFFAMKERFGVAIVYNVSFTMNAELEDKLSAMTKSKLPSTPYPDASYEWISGNPDKKAMDEIIKLLKIKNQPFLMLNLMQIVDEKEDEIYGLFSVHHHTVIVTECPF